MQTIRIEDLTDDQLEYALAVARGDRDVTIERPGYGVTNIVSTDHHGVRQVRNRVKDMAQAWPLFENIDACRYVGRSGFMDEWVAVAELGQKEASWFSQAPERAICLLALHWALWMNDLDEVVVEIPDELVEGAQ